MRFNYQARTQEGEVHTGQVEASSEETAISLLQRHGLYVTFLGIAKPPAYAIKINLFENVSKKDLVMFSRQLSIMFKSKVSLMESLRVIADQTKNLNFKEKIRKLSEDVEGGTAFSKTLSQYPKIFSAFYVAMVKAGEVSGKLSEVLNYLADHLEREYHLASKAKGALIYPAMVVLVMVFVLILMIYFVIPNLSQVLAQSEEPLPLITKIVLAGSDFLRTKGLFIFLAMLGVILAVARYFKTASGKKTLDRLMLRAPVLGNLLKLIYVTRYAENLSTLVAGGLPIAKALETVADVIGNSAYKTVVLTAQDKVRKGETISSVLAGSPDLFPPVVNQMVQIGEKTGSLDATLINIVDFYQKEIDRGIDNLLSIMEPLLMVFLGGAVGGIMLAIMMPMYKMMGL